jgi:hypothetical protein
MKLATKPTLVILGTLIVGIALGALLFSVFMRYRMQHLHKMMGPKGFHRSLTEAIGPMSGTQDSAVNSEIQRSSLRIDSTINAGRMQVDAMIDSMMTRLDSMLTADQRKRLHKELGARFGRGGPPPGMPHMGGPRPGDRRHDGPPPRNHPDDSRQPHDRPDDPPPPRD